MGKTKKQLEQIVLKKRQYRSNQGRSPEKTEANYKVIGIAFIGMLVGLLGMIISNWLNG